MLHMIAPLQNMLVKKFNDIPNNPDKKTAGNKIKSYCDQIVEWVGFKTPEKIVAEHATSIVFDCGKPPCTANINHAWWENNTHDELPQFLARSLTTFGPVDVLSPPYFKRANQGILIQGHAENNNMSPIEYLVLQVNMEFCRTDEPMDANEVMDGLVEIFTSTAAVSNTTIDNLVFRIVFTDKLTPFEATRLDLVHALHIVFYIGMLVYLANPEGFCHCHPASLIINIFLAQGNCFPANTDIDKPLSKVQQGEWLLTLGLNIFDAMRKEFDAAFFLNNADFFPCTTNPTMMPPSLAIGYRKPQDADADAGAPVFETAYFLFGARPNQAEPDTTIKAEPLDGSILPYYQYAVKGEYAQLNRDQLKTLITIVCPKETLNLTSKTYFGLKIKADMIALLTKHLPAFNTTNAEYITELSATMVEVEDE